MAANHTDTIRKLALENARLRDALKKADQLYAQATSKSLIAQIGMSDLYQTTADGKLDQAPMPELTAAQAPILLPPSPAMAALNRLKAPPLQSNPRNFKLGDHPLTDEQQQAVEHAVSGCSLKVEAGAGSGKTSGLSAISLNMGKRKGLYLAFNKDIIKEASSRFSQNTHCRTTHSVAYEGAGHPFSHRIQKKNLASKIIIDALHLSDFDGISKYEQANVIRQWVANFTHGASQQLDLDSAPWPILYKMTKKGDRKEAYLAAQPIASKLGPLAAMLWRMLSDVNGTLPIWPDVYLKIWALSRPVLGCDFILLDEAQDTSKVVLKVIMEQPCQVIWVGDRRQQIYGWRGAVNAMDAITTDQTCDLTRSFRYGQPVAEIANRVLQNFLGETSFKIVGSPMVESRLCEVPNPKAILCRGNKGALSELMDALKLGKKVHMAGDVSTLITEVESCISLMQHRRPRSPDFQMFDNWNELIDYSETEVGAELATLVKLIETWPPQELLVALNAVHKVSQAEADVTISTVHKAKGLQFPSVRLADDFAFPQNDAEKSKIPFTPEEARIFYVALTRAQYELDVTQCRAAHVALNWVGPPAVQAK